MESVSTKPYLVRAIHEWCADSGFTPYLLVNVDAETRGVPMEFVKDGQIVLNVGYRATQGLAMDNHFIRFSARFGGVPRNLEIPMANVAGIYARENGQGLFFNDEVPAADPATPAPDDEPPAPPKGRPTLRVVK